jgi:competence protein ComGC
MEENKPDQPTEQIAEEEPRENISLSDAMTGVITSPGETFEEVKLSSKKNYWLVPMLILIVVSMISSFLFFNDDELSQQVRDKQKKAMVENLEKKVKAGEMSREQMNEALEKAEKFMSKSGPFFYVSITLFPAIGIFILFLIKGLIFWGGLKIFKGTATYVNVLSVLGLAAVIDSILTIVNIVLSILMGKIVNIGPSLIVTAESVGENMNKFLSHFDVLGIWYLAVIAIGFAKAANVSTGKSFALVFVLWLIYICVTSFANVGFFGM